MPKPNPLKTLEAMRRAANPLRGKAAEQLSPLSYAIAVRQAAELERAGELLGAKPGALVQLAASPKKLQSALDSGQTFEQLAMPASALESPARRKFMKQVGSVAARQVLPAPLQTAASLLNPVAVEEGGFEAWAKRAGQRLQSWADDLEVHPGELLDIHSVWGDEPDFENFPRRAEVLRELMQGAPSGVDERTAEFLMHNLVGLDNPTSKLEAIYNQAKYAFRELPGFSYDDTSQLPVFNLWLAKHWHNVPGVSPELQHRLLEHFNPKYKEGLEQAFNDALVYGHGNTKTKLPAWFLDAIDKE